MPNKRKKDTKKDEGREHVPKKKKGRTETADLFSIGVLF